MAKIDSSSNDIQVKFGLLDSVVIPAQDLVISLSTDANKALVEDSLSQAEFNFKTAIEECLSKADNAEAAVLFLEVLRGGLAGFILNLQHTVTTSQR